jgi:hypothetical protein
MTTTSMQKYQVLRGAGWLLALLGLAEWLRFAAAPTYAFMALFTAVFGESPKDMLCMAMHHMAPLDSMAGMYLLMSVFHSSTWLKLIASRVIAAR